MISFAPYSPQDLERIELQPIQEKWRDLFLSPDYARSLDIRDMAWTALDGDRVLGCGGFAPQWEGRVVAWAVFGKTVPKLAWPRIIRKIKQQMRDVRGRVEITVPFGFGAGCRLADLLGFKVEGLMKGFGPDGSDHFLYSRVT